MGIWTDKVARRKNDEWVGGEKFGRIDGRADGAEPTGRGKYTIEVS